MIAEAVTLALSTFYTFGPSPSLDVVSYNCRAYERHIIEVPCLDGSEGPCYAASDIVAHVCTVEGLAATALQPDVGQVIFGCIEAVDMAGNRSDCVTQESFDSEAPVAR